MARKLCSLVLLSLGIGLFAFSACMPYADGPSAIPDVVGKWNWVRSAGGITGKQVYTPESQGYAKQIWFSADGAYREYHGDSLAIGATYGVTRKRTIFGMRDVIVFSGAEGRLFDLVIMRATETELGLSDPFPDGFGHSYVRARE